MSIASATAAEEGENKRKEWLYKLEAARTAEDW